MKGAVGSLCVALALSICVVWLLDGCAGAVKDAAEASYTAELLRCVDEAGSKAASQACRAAVDAKYRVDAAHDAALSARVTEGGSDASGD
jgi:hypothetical protein